MVRRRRRLLRAGGLAALFAVVGPGVLAGLSDDDPAGITTYSILGAKYGYRLLWVLALSTVALIVFHELGARMGVVTGKGLLALVREHYGPRGATVALAALVVANLGTLCAEFAGVAAGIELLAGISRYVSVPLAAIGVSCWSCGAPSVASSTSCSRSAAIFVAYVVSGVLALPDWGATARGLVVPGLPLTRDAVLVAVATLGTTLAPWGLAFIQSYAVDKRLTVEDLRYERIDVVIGAVLTGVIGVFIVVACAATLHVNGVTIDDASDAAGALEPLAGHARRRCSASASSAPRCSRRASCRCRRRTRSPRRSGPPTSTTASARRRCSTARTGERGARGHARADPGRAADPDPVPLAGAQRRAAARDPAVPAAVSRGSCGHGRPRLGLAGRVTTGITLALVAASVAALAVLSVA